MWQKNHPKYGVGRNLTAIGFSQFLLSLLYFHPPSWAELSNLYFFTLFDWGRWPAPQSSYLMFTKVVFWPLEVHKKSLRLWEHWLNNEHKWINSKYLFHKQPISNLVYWLSLLHNSCYILTTGNIVIGSKYQHKKN